MKKNTVWYYAAVILLIAGLFALCTGCSEEKIQNVTEGPTTVQTEQTVTTEPVEITEPVEVTEPVEETEPADGRYAVLLLPSAHGTLTSDLERAGEGETVTLSAVPEEGYELNSLTVNGEICQGTFTMPAEKVYVVARFALIAKEDKAEEPAVVYPNGTFFGSAGSCHSSPVLNMNTDRGENPYLKLDAGKATPLYTYVKNMRQTRFYVEMTAGVTGIRKDESYPKIGLMVNDGREMMKFYLDMNTDKQVSAVGAVRQLGALADDWASQTVWQLAQKLDLSSGTVKLGLLRDGQRFYYYVNGQLVATGDLLSANAAAAGFFSFGTSVKLTGYACITDEQTLVTMLEQAQKAEEVFAGCTLTENYFTKNGNGSYTLTTDSDAGHLVDDVLVAGQIMRKSNYSLKGKLTLTDAGDWGQARILISADPSNEYFIALEKTNAGIYQIFTMSNADGAGWSDWYLIESAERNGGRNSLDFEVIVAEDQLYFLVEDQICYTSQRVNMTQSTVKFTGMNVGTTGVEGMTLTGFETQAEALAYAATKGSRFGDTFGFADAYWTTRGFDTGKDSGTNATVKCTDGAPQYAYVNGVFTDKFVFETSVNVEKVLNNDGYPKFGLLVNGASEMVKFFVDMTPAMTANQVGVVYQPAGGGDDWGGSRSVEVPGMGFTGNDKVKLKLVRDGRAYYFYVNDTLVLFDSEGFKTENGAVGIFSFNSVMTASAYSVGMGADADSAIESAKAELEERNKIALTTNYFTHKGNGVYTLTTNSTAGHMVDDVTRGGAVVKAACYSLKGRLSLTGAGNWGQARILISADSKNEYVIALEKTDKGVYQIFTMSKSNQNDWDKWELIYPSHLNGSRNVLDFEIIADGQQMYFLIGDKVYYKASRVNLAESTVKFTGYNTATTTVEGLSLTTFGTQAEAKAYAGTKASCFSTFGVSQGSYWTTEGFDLSQDANGSVKCTGGAPQYAYVNGVFTDKFVFETCVNVEKVLNNDGYPKFGLLVNGASEMVKFFVDMTPAMTANQVGVVYQPTGGGDNWGGSISKNVPGMSFTGSNTVKLKLVRDGRAYYLYVNDVLVLHNATGFRSESGAVGLFSFNAVMTASNYSIATGSAADSAIESAKADLTAK